MKVPGKRNSKSWWFHRVNTVAFVALIWIPAVGLFVDFDPTAAVDEKRQLAQFPGVDGTPLSREQVRAFFSDHIGLRDSMLRLHANVKSGVFKTSNHRQIVMGEDGWYFCDYDRAVKAATGRIKLRETHVDRWKTVLKQRADYLEEKGIKYAFLMVPDKHYIHGNRLPEFLREPLGPPVLDQFVEKVSLPNVHLLDIRSELLETSKNHDTFYKGDTHWNGHGKAAGYRGILRHLREIMTTPEYFQPNEVDVSPVAKAGPGGLYRALAIDDVTSEPRSSCKLRVSRARKETVPAEYYALAREYQADQQKLCVYENPACDGPRLVMFHTSFTIGTLRALLAEHFSRAVFVRHPGNYRIVFHKEIVEREKPDIVINEIPSRYLMMNPLIAYDRSEWTDSSIRVASKDDTKPRGKRK